MTTPRPVTGRVRCRTATVPPAPFVGRRALPPTRACTGRHRRMARRAEAGASPTWQGHPAGGTARGDRRRRAPTHKVCPPPGEGAPSVPGWTARARGVPSGRISARRQGAMGQAATPPSTRRPGRASYLGAGGVQGRSMTPERPGDAARAWHARRRRCEGSQGSSAERQLWLFATGPDALR